jgi:hypothetical protein
VSADGDLLRVAMRRDAFTMASFSLLPAPSRRRTLAVLLTVLGAAALAAFLSGIAALYPLGSQGNVGASLVVLESLLLGGGLAGTAYGRWLAHDHRRIVAFYMSQATTAPSSDAMHRWGSGGAQMPSWKDLESVLSGKRKAA